MKITKSALIFIIPGLISCYGNASKTTNSNDTNYDILYNDSIAAVEDMLREGEEYGEKINAFLNEYISKHPDCFNNNIQREKAGKELHSLLKEKFESDPDFISDIPVEFAAIKKAKSSDNKGYKYLTSFTCSSLYRTGKYNISFSIITALSEEEASKLIDNNKYNIKGNFVDFSEKKSIKIGINTFDEKTIEIGGIFLKEPVITPALE